MLAAVLFAGLCSCKKTGNPASYMRAMVNGASFSRNNCVAAIDSAPVSLSIFGANYNPNAAPTLYATPLIHLGVFNFKGVGVYPVTDTLTASSTISAGWANFESSYTVPLSVAVYGVVTITSTTPDITGTFSFTCGDSTKVTNGTFSAQAP